MLRTSDLPPPVLRPLTAAPTRSAEASRPSTWFDEAPFGPAAAISTELRAESRGLSTEQHAQRVLAQLCGDDRERA